MCIVPWFILSSEQVNKAYIGRTYEASGPDGRMGPSSIFDTTLQTKLNVQELLDSQTNNIDRYGLLNEELEPT